MVPGLDLAIFPRSFTYDRKSIRKVQKASPRHFTCEGDLAKYLPLMEIASKVHVGKQTTFGMGKIKAEILDGAPNGFLSGKLDR